MSKHLHVPPVCLLLAGLLMWLMDRFLPWQRFHDDGLAIAGAILIFGGFILAAWAAAHMRKQGAAIHPHDQPKNLVTNGVFKYSRNPIYLGMLLALFGWACRLGSLSPFFIAPIFGWWISEHFIQREERQLLAKYESRFRQYMATTRRWL